MNKKYLNVFIIVLIVLAIGSGGISYYLKVKEKAQLAQKGNEGLVEETDVGEDAEWIFLEEEILPQEIDSWLPYDSIYHEFVIDEETKLIFIKYDEEDLTDWKGKIILEQNGQETVLKGDHHLYGPGGFAYKVYRTNHPDKIVLKRGFANVISNTYWFEYLNLDEKEIVVTVTYRSQDVIKIEKDEGRIDTINIDIDSCTNKSNGDSVELRGVLFNNETFFRLEEPVLLKCECDALLTYKPFPSFNEDLVFSTDFSKIKFELVLHGLVEKEGGEEEEWSVLWKKPMTLDMSDFEAEEEEAEYPVRWTDYAIMDDLSQIDDLLDDLINDLSVLQWSLEEDSLRLVDRLEDEVYVKTCRDYLYYKERGFGPYTTMEINQSTYFDLACCHLQLFKQAEGSRESYLSDFNLARDWQDLPARELFSLYQMGTLAETEDDVFSSEIREANEFYVHGENPEITHEYGDNFSFQLYLFGWGDFDHDGIEDILLYTKIQTALWNFTPGEFVIISKKNEDSPIEMESIYSHSYDGEFDKRLSVKKKSPLQLEDTFNWQTYRNEEFGYEIKYPLDGNLREIYSGLPEVPSESNVGVSIENVLINIHSWDNKDNYKTLEELISGEKNKQEKGLFTVFSTIPDSYQEFLVGGEPAIKWSTYHDTVGKIATTTIVLKGNYFYDIGGKGDAFISNFGDKEEGIYNLFLSTFKFIDSEENM